MLLHLHRIRGIRVRPVGALIDPESNQLNLLIGERLPAHRHSADAAKPRHAPVESALVGFARQDVFAQAAPRQRRLLQVEPQAAQLRVRSVALVTVLLEDGLDVLKEIDPPSGARAGSDLRLRLSQRRPQTRTATAERKSVKSQNSDDDLATGHRGSLATKTTG